MWMRILLVVNPDLILIQFIVSYLVLQEDIRAEGAVFPGAAGQAAPGGGVQGRAGGEAAHHCRSQYQGEQGQRWAKRLKY